jgi:hypothetical protein
MPGGSKAGEVSARTCGEGSMPGRSKAASARIASRNGSVTRRPGTLTLTAAALASCVGAAGCSVAGEPCSAGPLPAAVWMYGCE